MIFGEHQNDNNIIIITFRNGIDLHVTLCPIGHNFLKLLCLTQADWYLSFNGVETRFKR